MLSSLQRVGMKRLRYGEESRRDQEHTDVHQDQTLSSERQCNPSRDKWIEMEVNDVVSFLLRCSNYNSQANKRPS